MPSLSNYTLLSSPNGSEGRRGFFHFLVLDMCSKLIFCSKLPRTAKNCLRLLEPPKNCSKGSEHNQYRPSFNSSVVPYVR